MISPMYQPKDTTVPPLRDGDRLTSEEFERRWDSMPYLKRAELICGRVSLRTEPVSWTWHAEPLGRMVLPVATYAGWTPRVSCGVAPSIWMETSSIPQPDLSVRVDEDCGGRSRIEDGYVVGSPEFIVEVADNYEQHDLNEKKDLYRRAGVQEYLNWNVIEQRIVLFQWNAGNYVEIDPDVDGILKSRILPGLWFDSVAMMRGDKRQGDRWRVMEVIHLGLQSQEHPSFVGELRDFPMGQGGHL